MADDQLTIRAVEIARTADRKGYMVFIATTDDEDATSVCVRDALGKAVLTAFILYLAALIQ